MSYLFVGRGKYDSKYDSHIWKSFVGAAVATMGIIPYVVIALAYIAGRVFDSVVNCFQRLQVHLHLHEAHQ